MEEVYGFEMTDGTGDFFRYTADHLFADIWNRPGLTNRDRRLLLIGMLTGSNQTDVLSIQVPAALAAGELDEVALREITILACHYAGWPIGSRVNQVVEESIAKHNEVVSGFVHEDLPTAEVDRREALKRPLADAVRDLVDATIRTTVDDDEVRAVHAELETLVARLRADQLPGSAGGRYDSERRAWHWGNAVIGAQRDRPADDGGAHRVRPGARRHRAGRGLRRAARARARRGDGDDARPPHGRDRERHEAADVHRHAHDALPAAARRSDRCTSRAGSTARRAARSSSSRRSPTPRASRSRRTGCSSSRRRATRPSGPSGD